MEEKDLISIIDPNGEVSTVEYVADFELDGKKYLVYNKGEKTNNDIDCYIVRLTSDKEGYLIEDIDDDAEFARVSQKLDDIIMGEEQ